MMGPMSSRRPAHRAIAEGQLDLFDDGGQIDGERVPTRLVEDAGETVGRLANGELIARLPQADRSSVEALCSQVVSRSLEAAVPALERLWRRFAGFGVRVPFPEQRAVLDTLARVDGAAARAALKRIVLSKGLPASLLPAALRAAAEAELALPASFVAPLLDHEDVAVREPAFALALKAGIGGDRLRDGLIDPSACVRRLAAVALGNRRDAGGREWLIGELARNPSTEVIEALAAIGDDDAIVHLGRCAARHPALAGTVVAILRDMESAKAERLVRRLEAGGLPSGSDGS